MDKPKKRILVVDDEASITRMLKLNLERTGKFEVMTENSPHHALTAARSFHPDLILLDVLMPGKDGSELASNFQASPALKHVPVVFLTAAATKDEVKTHHGKIGGLPFLAKPVDLHEVIDCLDQNLGG
jgi:CheY-like chemotaxis protein